MASEKRSDGEGSIYQRHKPTCDRPRDARGRASCSCPWQGAIVTGWRDGKPIRRKVTGRSAATAKAKLRELRAKVEAGALPQGRPPTVAEWMTHWLEQIAAAKVRPSTLRGYRTSVTQYIVPLLGEKRLDKLTAQDIEQAWEYLQRVGNPAAADPTPLSSTSAHQAHRALSRALRIAQQRRLVVDNVAAMLEYIPQPAHSEMQALTRPQAARALDAARERRNAARWRVALAVGLRQGEALALRWEDVDLDAGTITVRRALSRVKGQGLVFGPVKSRAGQRLAPLPRELAAELPAHRARQAEERLAAGNRWHDHDLVFAREDGRPIDPRADWEEWKSILAQAGLPAIRLHDARHSAATMMLAAGVPARVVQEWLGHSQLSVTMKYQHVVDDIHRDAAAKLDTYWG